MGQRKGWLWVQKGENEKNGSQENWNYFMRVSRKWIYVVLHVINELHTADLQNLRKLLNGHLHVMLIWDCSNWVCTYFNERMLLLCRYLNRICALLWFLWFISVSPVVLFCSAASSAGSVWERKREGRALEKAVKFWCGTQGTTIGEVALICVLRSPDSLSS